MDSGIPNSPGRRIAQCRERRGWTQKDLAEKASISVTFLSEVENDRRKIGSEALLGLAEALDASLDYLMKGETLIQEKRSLVLPPELTEAAEENQWSVGEAMDILRARQMVLARRSRDFHSDTQDRPLSKEEWVELHSSLFRDERD